MGPAVSMRTMSVVLHESRKGTTSDYSIASELGCDIGIDMFWALRTTVVYCGMRAIWHAMIGVAGIPRVTSKEFMTMSASCFLLQSRLT